MIFERLKDGTDELRQKTEAHLDEFANNGLRTLCLAYKVIGSEEYEEWNQRYHDATIALEDRDKKIDAASDEIEWGLRLLGATAIEDRLQDGVPETIADLKRAGIKVLVATGDKLETAIGRLYFREYKSNGLKLGYSYWLQHQPYCTRFQSHRCPWREVTQCPPAIDQGGRNLFPRTEHRGRRR